MHKLEDIEWKFGVTAANSELEHVRSPNLCDPLRFCACGIVSVQMCVCAYPFVSGRHHVPAAEAGVAAWLRAAARARGAESAAILRVPLADGEIARHHGLSPSDLRAKSFKTFVFI